MSCTPVARSQHKEQKGQEEGDGEYPCLEQGDGQTDEEGTDTEEPYSPRSRHAGDQEDDRGERGRGDMHQIDWSNDATEVPLGCSVDGDGDEEQEDPEDTLKPTLAQSSGKADGWVAQMRERRTQRGKAAGSVAMLMAVLPQSPEMLRQRASASRIHKGDDEDAKTIEWQGDLQVSEVDERKVVALPSPGSDNEEVEQRDMGHWGKQETKVNRLERPVEEALSQGTEAFGDVLGEARQSPAALDLTGGEEQLQPGACQSSWDGQQEVDAAVRLQLPFDDFAEHTRDMGSRGSYDDEPEKGQGDPMEVEGRCEVEASAFVPVGRVDATDALPIGEGLTFVPGLCPSFRQPDQGVQPGPAMQEWQKWGAEGLKPCRAVADVREEVL